MNERISTLPDIEKQRYLEFILKGLELNRDYMPDNVYYRTINECDEIIGYFKNAEKQLRMYKDRLELVVGLSLH